MPLSTEKIRESAQGLRDALNLKDQTHLEIVPIMELLDYHDFFTLEIIPKDEMPSDYGLYIPSYKAIHIREDIYDKARSGEQTSRETMAHELGHWCLAHDTYFPKNEFTRTVNIEENAEWQADKWAQEFFIDTRQLELHVSPRAIEKQFGVTFRMAEIAYTDLRTEKIIK